MSISAPPGWYPGLLILAFFRHVGDRLEHESVRFEPERRVAMLAILRKRPRLVKYLGALREGPVVGFPDDRTALHQEGYVLQARAVAGVGLGLECLIEDQL